MATTPQYATLIHELKIQLVELHGKLERWERAGNSSILDLNEDIAELSSGLDQLEQSLKTTEKLVERHDERIKALEKATDRLWQFVPVVLSFIALLVSIYNVFSKK